MPRISLPGHITGEPELEDFDVDFDDVASTYEIIQRTETPGLDSLRGTFGAIGTIIRAKRRARALSAASQARAELTAHAHEDSGNSEGVARSRGRSGSSGTSGHFRPSWLPHGAWHTPRGSRFQAMEIPDDAPPVPPLPDLEKGEVEMRENGAPAGRNRSNISSLVEFPAVWFRSRSSSPAAQRTSAVQIDSIRERPSKQSLASQKRLSVVESERPSDIEKLGSPGASGSSRDDEDGEDSDDEGSFKSLNEKDVTEY